MLSSLTGDLVNSGLSFAGPDLTGYSPEDFALVLTDSDLTAFSTLALPLLPPDLSFFEHRDLSLSFVRDYTIAYVTMELTGLTLTSLSEPSSLLLIIVGLIAACVTRRVS